VCRGVPNRTRSFGTSVTELAVELEAPILAAEFKTLNLCLDDAIAEAVTEYGRQRERQDCP
jgi:hypothetical protein